MTYITFYQDSDGVVTGFDTSGHAGYSRQGEDIICAAISALVINAVNSIEQFTEDAFKVDVDRENGGIVFRLEAKPSKEAVLLLNSLILGLQRMEDEEENRQYIDVIFEEV